MNIYNEIDSEVQYRYLENIDLIVIVFLYFMFKV